MTRRVGIAVGAIALVAFAVGGHGQEAMRPAMGTYARISVGDTTGPAAEAVYAALDEIDRLERIMTTYDPSSDLSQLNHSGSDTFHVIPASLHAVLASALYYYKLSGGAFDVTVRPLVQHWKSCRDWPSPDVVATLLTRVGSGRVRLDDSTCAVQRPVGVTLDLGAIGKGFAVDRAVDVLRERGIRSATVDVGRTLYVFGSGPHGGGYEVGIAHPSGNGELAAVIDVRDAGVSTSGNYEQGRVVDGRRVGHIIDPRSGYPVDHDVASVTVVAPTATAADALTTALFVLGPEPARELLSQLDDVEAMMIIAREDRSYGYIRTEGLKPLWIAADIRE